MTMSIKYNYRASYGALAKESLVISAWKYGKWTINTFCGEVRIPLMKVVTDNINRVDDIKVKMDGKMKNSLRINYRCYFQEVWNYKLRFSDFKITNLQNKQGKPYSSMVEFKFGDSGSFLVSSSVSTSVVENDKNPLWETISGNLSFKGPIYELENKDMIINVKDAGGLKKESISDNRISLKGLSTNASVRVPIKVPLSSSTISKTTVRGTVGGGVQPNSQKGEEDLLAVDFYYTYLEGRITIMEKPKYFQKGEALILRESGRYLCVQIGKLENLLPPENVGKVNTFVTVHWGNQKNSTRTIFDNYAPTFNEEMYFKIPINKDPRDPKFYKDLLDNLKSKAEIVIYIWLDLTNGAYQNIGYSTCTLSELAGQIGEEKGFYDFENKKYIKRDCRVATLKQKVTSSFTDHSSTFINLSFYFMPDIDPSKLDVTELKKVSGDKMDPWVYKAVKNGESSEPYITHRSFIRNNLKELESFRENNFHFIYGLDQCRVSRFLPTYLDVFNLDYTPPKSPEYELSKILTAKEIFAFVNNIPFIDDYKKHNLIVSPDFTLTQNKGTITDHVILLACLMMGCKYENESEEKQDKKLSEQFMKELVGFENRVFVCIGTNKFSKKRELWLMTFNRDPTNVVMWDVKTGMSYELKGRVKDEGDDLNILKQYLIGVIAETQSDKKDDDHDNSKQEEEEKKDIFKSDEFRLDNLMKKENSFHQEDPHFMHKLYMHTDYMPQKNNFDNFVPDTGDKNGARMEAVHEFMTRKEKVVSSEQLPWGSIELIFNHRNIWANLQHQNPTKIYYSLNKKDLWRPYLSVVNEGKKGDTGEMDWLGKVGSFFCITNFESPFSPEQIKEIEADMYKNFKFVINCGRSGLNLDSKFKSPRDKLTLLLNDYLCLLYKFETGKEGEEYVLTEASKIAQDIKELIPRDYRFSYLPLRFSIANTERIQSIFKENFSDFFLKVKDPCMFAISCKLFPLPNKVNSLRVIVCHISKIISRDINKNEDKDMDLDEDNNWDTDTVGGTDKPEANFF